jgi:hypothetical protein
MDFLLLLETVADAHIVIVIDRSAIDQPPLF